MKAKISIIIPVYNSELFISQCLTSVARQSYRNIEVICVDDGSTDKTPDIINNFINKDHRFSHIHKEHTNAADARNLGLSRALGEYIAFLDADDFLDDGILEKYAEATLTGADIIISKYKLFDNLKNKSLKTAYGIHTNKRQCFCLTDIKTKKFDITNIAVWNKLYKASFIKQNNLHFKSHKSLNDMYFGLVSLALAKTIYLCRHVSTNYRLNVSGSISANILHTKDIFFDVLSEINDRLCLEKSWPQIKKDLLRAEEAQLAEFYARLKKADKIQTDADNFKKSMNSFLQYYVTK